MVGAAVAGVAISAITTGMAVKDKIDAKNNADNMVKPKARNPYAGLSINTTPGNFQGQQAQRTMATQTAALGQSGGRGLAFMPGVARQQALTDQQIAADFTQQGRQNQLLYAQGEQQKQNREFNQYNAEQRGYGQQYAAANQNIFSGINQGLGVLSSGFSQGGVFNQGQAPSYQLPYQNAVQNYNTNAGLYQPTATPPLAYQSLVAK